MREEAFSSFGLREDMGGQITRKEQANPIFPCPLWGSDHPRYPGHEGALPRDCGGAIALGSIWETGGIS